MSRPRTVYRGKRKYGWLISLLLFIVAIVVVLAAWLFYSLQTYIVYDKDGLHLELPSEAGELAQTGETETETDLSELLAPPVNAEIVIGLPDYSHIEQLAGEDLEVLKAQYVAAENVSAANLPYYAASLDQSGGGALLLEMKTDEGMLSYASGIALTASYGVNGTEVLFDTIDALKEDGVYLAAEIGCLVDNAMAVRNAPIALKHAVTGSVLSDNSGMWLDPYNDVTREYLAALIRELADMGFDEVVLSGLYYPESDSVRYSQTMTAMPDPVSFVSSLAIYLRQVADEEGIRLSAYANGNGLRQAENKSGQDMELFFKLFDRVFVETGYDYYNADMSTLQSYAGSAASSRVVPVTTAYIPESPSWTVK